MVEVISQHYIIIFFFFLIAVLYSSVGFGGGSSYLAVLALTSLAYTQIRSTALLCNILVVLSNVIIFVHQKQVDWKKVLPIVLLSIPFAFLGGYVQLNQRVFFILLGFTLMFAAISMWLSHRIVSQKTSKPYTLISNSFIGSGIGFLSGLVGIGGGIFLAPLLHLTNWDTPKRIAAVSSLFILLNSISGFSGHMLNSNFEIDWNLTYVLLMTVFLGSLIGNRMRNSLFSPILLKKATAILVAFVGIRILYFYFFWF